MSDAVFIRLTGIIEKEGDVTWLTARSWEPSLAETR